MPKGKDHSLVELARWTVQGTDVPGEMTACTACGLVMINDRRGTLLIHGGLGSVHKHLSPTQKPSQCPGTLPSVSDTLNNTVRELIAKHDPRFQVVPLPEVPAKERQP
jgi:hypothetical protein